MPKWAIFFRCIGAGDLVLGFSQQFFCHITMLFSCGKELFIHFYRAASLKFYAADSRHSTLPTDTESESTSQLHYW